MFRYCNDYLVSCTTSIRSSILSDLAGFFSWRNHNAKRALLFIQWFSIRFVCNEDFRVGEGRIQFRKRVHDFVPVSGLSEDIGRKCLSPQLFAEWRSRA